MLHERPAPCVAQLSGTDPDGRFILSVVLRQTFVVVDGRCEPAPTQEPLVVAAVPDSVCAAIMAADSDLFPYKPRTDVVVRGHAYAHDGARRFQVALSVGDHTQRLHVVGDRRCALRGDGALVLSEPEPVERVPLGFDRAYGGRDLVAEAERGNPFATLSPYLSPDISVAAASPYAYPRNPAGRGYLVSPTRAAVEALALPNLELVDEPVRVESLAVGAPSRWAHMPAPGALGWCAYHWFPRITALGLVPAYDEPPDGLSELRRGWITADDLRRERRADFRFANGAAPAWQLPHLRGGERCALGNLHPKHARWGFTLPDAPQLSVDGRDEGLLRTTPVLHTVVVEPDRDTVSLVWRGSALARRPYLPDELDAMPLRAAW